MKKLLIISICLLLTLLFLTPGLANNTLDENSKIYELGKEPQQISSNDIKREFSWISSGRNWKWVTYISNSDYKYYSSLSRMIEDEAIYINNTIDDIYFKNLANNFKEAQQKYNLSNKEVLELAINLVQSINYKSDKESKSRDDYFKYPLETLVDMNGDCEDTSILLAAILKEMGYEVILLNLPEHMAVGIKDTGYLTGNYYTYQGNKYYYIESGSIWNIGTIPYSIKDRNAQVISLQPKPILYYNCFIKESSVFYNVETTVYNKGTSKATNVQVHATYEIVNNNYEQIFKSESVNIEPNKNYTLNVYLPHLGGIIGKIRIKILNNNETINDISTNDFLIK